MRLWVWWKLGRGPSSDLSEAGTRARPRRASRIGPPQRLLVPGLDIGAQAVDAGMGASWQTASRLTPSPGDGASKKSTGVVGHDVDVVPAPRLFSSMRHRGAQNREAPCAAAQAVVERFSTRPRSARRSAPRCPAFASCDRACSSRGSPLPTNLVTASRPCLAPCGAGLSMACASSGSKRRVRSRLTPENISSRATTAEFNPYGGDARVHSPPARPGPPTSTPRPLTAPENTSERRTKPEPGTSPIEAIRTLLLGVAAFGLALGRLALASEGVGEYVEACRRSPNRSVARSNRCPSISRGGTSGHRRRGRGASCSCARSPRPVG